MPCCSRSRCRPPPHNRFGAGLASGDVNDDGLRDLLVGAPVSDLNGSYSGATYAYTVVLDVVPYCSAKVSSQGCSPSIFSTGTPGFTAGTFRVKASDVVNNKNGILFWGRTPTATPFQGGYLCVASPATRTPVQSSGGNPPPDDCSGAFSFHFSPGYMSAQGVQVGEQLYGQYWFRDPPVPSGSGLSDALALRVLP